jgi:predicted TIM-barrel fold metal-dependent hydrolase
MAELAFSADSHVIEDPALWDGLLSEGFWGPERGKNFHQRAGGLDPIARVDEMAVDGVGGEVLYPSLGLRLFALEDAELQLRCFRRYNDWLAEFCRTAPDRLLGVALVPTYDIDVAVTEYERTQGLGLRGALVWQTPHPDLPFMGSHYDPLWAAIAASGDPLSVHILTGHNYSREMGKPAEPGTDPVVSAIEAHRGSVGLKLLAVTDTLMELIFSGVFDRFPGLRLVLVENEIGWLPFVLDQWDYYVDRFQQQRPLPIGKKPSEYFGDQVFATFFRDPVGAELLSWWGQDGCLWSNDYPHANSTWPESQQWIADHLGHLPDAVVRRLVHDNAVALYERS